MDNLEIIYDHYKETFSLSKEAQKRRNKSFVILCVLEALSFLLLIRPEKAFALMMEGLNHELNMTLQLSNTILQTLLWILLAYVMIRYVQDMMYVERQYSYLSKLEKSISEATDEAIFNREGTNYLSDYPIVLNLIDLFYKMLMPILFTVINVVRIIREIINANDITIAIVCDSIIFLAIFLITWFYFFEIHSKISNFCKKYIPFVDGISVWIKKILKEV